MNPNEQLTGIYSPTKQNGSIPPPPSPPKEETDNTNQQIQNKTVIVKGLPLDSTDREIGLFFRKDPGYERCYFKIQGGEKISLAIFSNREFAELAAQNNKAAIYDKTLNVIVTVELLIPSAPTGHVGQKRKRDHTDLISQDITKKQKVDHPTPSFPYPRTFTIPKTDSGSTTTKPTSVPYSLIASQLTNPMMASGGMVPNPMLGNPNFLMNQNVMMNQGLQGYNQFGGYRGGFRGRGRGGYRGTRYRGRGRGRGRGRSGGDGGFSPYYPKEPRKTLWVGNIPRGETNEELAEHIQKTKGLKGLRQVKIMHGTSGIGFIMFDNIEQATQAKEILTGSYYKGSNFAVDYAKRDMRIYEDEE